MKVVIIGSGNVATVLGKKILLAGHTIEQVISKTKSHARELATILKSSASDNLLEINGTSELIIIAVADDTISQVAAKLKLSGKTIVHTAGSVSMETLKNTGANYGVLYPIQSLKKELPYLPGIPIAIDGNNEATKDLLRDFAETWASQVSFANDEERLKLHIAAVVSSNFVNHLYDLAEIYCTKEKLDFKMLVPLIEETANRIASFSASEVQTGPAARGDIKTIDKHLRLLNAHPAVKSIYMKMTESIINTNKGRDL